MKFEKILRKTQKELKGYVSNYLRSMGYTTVVRDGFVYASGELPVLLVAHLDTVHSTPPQTIYYSKDGKKLMCAEGIGGDDRCGVYMILNIVKELKCHVLFCEDEEVGGIGAEKFTGSGIIPIVNYIIEFDRKGSNDAVFYNCDNKDFTKFITSFGFKEAYGSFSDISIIAPALGVAAVNLSSGYYNAHMKNEYINMRDMESVMSMAKEVIQTKTDKYKYVEREVVSFRNNNGFSYSDYSSNRSYKNYNYGYDGYSIDDFRKYRTSPIMVKPITTDDGGMLYDLENGVVLGDVYTEFGYYMDKHGYVYEDSGNDDLLLRYESYELVNENGETILYSELRSPGCLHDCCDYDDYCDYCDACGV